MLNWCVMSNKYPSPLPLISRVSFFKLFSWYTSKIISIRFAFWQKELTLLTRCNSQELPNVFKLDSGWFIWTNGGPSMITASILGLMYVGLSTDSGNQENLALCPHKVCQILRVILEKHDFNEQRNYLNPQL